MLLSVPQMNQPPVSLWRSLDWPATLEQKLRILESVILYMLGGTVEPQVHSMLHFYICWQSQTAKRVFLTSPALGHPKNLGPFREDSQHSVHQFLCASVSANHCQAVTGWFAPRWPASPLPSPGCWSGLPCWILVIPWFDICPNARLICLVWGLEKQFVKWPWSYHAIVHFMCSSLLTGSDCQNWEIIQFSGSLTNSRTFRWASHLLSSFLESWSGCAVGVYRHLVFFGICSCSSMRWLIQIYSLGNPIWRWLLVQSFSDWRSPVHMEKYDMHPYNSNPRTIPLAERKKDR